MDASTYEKTELLLPLNGADSGVVFTDYSPRNLLVTVYGNTQTKTAQYKYYDSSTYFDGTGDYLTIPNSSICLFGTSDFYIGLWVYRVGNNVLQGLIDTRPGANGAYPLMYIASDNKLYYYVSSANRISGDTVPQNTWCLIEVERVSGTTRLYIDGVQTGSNWSDSTDYLVGSALGIVGKTFDNYYYTGYMQDIHIVKGAGTGRTGKLTGIISNSGSGIDAVKDDAGTAAIRNIRALVRGIASASAVAVFQTQSDASGRYSLQVPMAACDVIFEDDTAGTQYSDI